MSMLSDGLTLTPKGVTIQKLRTADLEQVTKFPLCVCFSRNDYRILVSLILPRFGRFNLPWCFLYGKIIDY